MRSAVYLYRTGRLQAAQQGFVYLALLLFLAMYGAMTASVVAAGANIGRRAAEEELLFVGQQFRNAIQSYYESGAGGRRYPVSLDELLVDKRTPGVHRHLRKVFTDPLTGNEDWGLVRTPDGVGIVGVYSKAAGAPVKVDGFTAEWAAFQGAAKYSDWVFAYVPRAANRVGAGTTPAPVLQPGVRAR